jgi:IS4 transposase
MAIAALDEEWNLLAGFLPPRWREAARETGALARARGIKDADTLLRLILLHAASGLSLRQAVARASAAGLAQISDVALLKRLRRAEPWLRSLTVTMLARSRFAPRLPALPPKWQVRVVDATNVEEPGATGTDWRIHYTLALPSLACDFFEVTDVKGGETYKRVPVRRGDVILGDRGYTHREGVAHVLEKHGEVVVRLNATSFPLLDSRARPFAILPALKSLKAHEPGEWAVQFEAKGRRFKARLCAVRKTKAAAERSKRKATKASAKKHRTIRPETLEMAEYVAVLTTLPRKEFPADLVLELYRARWQVELAFKRIKSLLGAGHVPKKDARSCKAWIQAKLLTALLIEELVGAAGLFSPWGFMLPETQLLARVHRGP